MSTSLETPRVPAGAPAGGRALDVVVGFVLPLGVTLASLAWLSPSRMEGGGGGPAAWLARACDEQPLLLGFALFVALAGVARYWLRRAEARAVFAATAPERASARFAIVLVSLAAAAVLARVGVVEIHRVVGPSMVPTLKSGDRLLVNKLAYGLRVPFSARALGARAPRRGDIVVFPNEGRVTDAAAPRALVKRVIGLPGDVVGSRNGTLIINGWAVPSCDAGPFLGVAGDGFLRARVAVEILEDRAYLTLRSPTDETVSADFKVPPGEVFVVGDDRPASTDSRTWNGGRGGGVGIASLEGRVSRLALGRFRDGRLDLAHPLQALGLTLREPRIDVRKLEERIAACVAHRPPSTSPPAAPK